MSATLKFTIEEGIRGSAGNPSRSPWDRGSTEHWSRQTLNEYLCGMKGGRVSNPFCPELVKGLSTHCSVYRPVGVRTTCHPPCTSVPWGPPSGNPGRSCRWRGLRRGARTRTRILAPASSAPCTLALHTHHTASVPFEWRVNCGITGRCMRLEVIERYETRYLEWSSRGIHPGTIPASSRIVGYSTIGKPVKVRTRHFPNTRKEEHSLTHNIFSPQLNYFHFYLSSLIQVPASNGHH